MGRLLGIGFSVWALFLSSAQVAPALPLADDAAQLTISGTVFFEDSHRGAENVNVELRNPQGELVASANTGAAGRFEFRGLARKWYSVSVDLAGYEPVALPVDLSSGSSPAIEIFLKRKSGGAPAPHAATISARELAIPEKARELFASGKRKLYVDKDFQAALRDFQKAAGAAPGYYEAHYQIAMAYLALGNRDEAEQGFRTAIEASGGTYGDAQIALGRSILDRGHAAEAEKFIRRGLALEPDSWIGHYELGRALASENRIAEAQKSAELARAIAPNVPMVYELLAGIHFQQKDYTALLKDLEMYIQLDPDSSDGRRARQLRAEAIAAIGDQKVSAAEHPAP